METINNMASAAAKAVWGEGENTQEPRSGVQGNTAAGEPFDAGNMDPNTTTANGTTNTDAAAGTPGNNANTGAASGISGTTGASTTADERTTSTGTDTGAAASSSSVNPAAVEDSSVTKGDSSKGQNDTRDPSNPTTHTDKAEAAKNVDDTESGPGTTEPKGPGPKPVDELAREHGGDAGQVGEGAGASGGEGGKPAAGGNKDGDGDGPQSTSTGEGTGEKWVKTSGLQAEGGNFDAAVAGAGREADRIMEEKGMHNPTDDSKKAPAEPSEATKHSSHGSSHGAGGAEETKEKKGLGEKIKAKLHKH